MKKNTLIKLLQNIKGNPDIVLWNGFVDDYMHISKDIGEIILAKKTKKGIEQDLQFVYFQNTGKVLDMTSDDIKAKVQERYTSQKFGDINDYTFERDKDYYGKTKTMVCLNFELRHKEVFDRLGTIKY